MIWRYLVPLFWETSISFQTFVRARSSSKLRGSCAFTPQVKPPQISAVLRTNRQFSWAKSLRFRTFRCFICILSCKSHDFSWFHSSFVFFRLENETGTPVPHLRWAPRCHWGLKIHNWRSLCPESVAGHPRTMAPWFYLVYLDPWLPGNGKSHISCRWMWFMLVNVENSSTSWPRLRLSQRFFGVKSLNGTIRVCGDPRSSSNGQLYHSDLNNNYGTMKYIGLW